MNLIDLLPLSENKLKVLYELYSEKEDYLRNLERKTKINPSLLHRILQGMVQSKTVSAQRKGKEVYYVLSKKSIPLLQPLLEQYSLDAAINRNSSVKTVVQLLTHNSEMMSSCQRIYLFGSAVNGRIGKDSDIDLLFVTNESKKVVAWAKEVSIATGREINPLIYTPGKFREELRKKEALLTSIIQNVKNRAIIKV